MNINQELLQFYTYKKLIKRKRAPEILSECKAKKHNVRDYLLTKEIITETSELEARAAYYCMPSVEIDMLDIDDSLFEKFTYDFMKKHKIIPIKYDKNGTLLVATGNPLSCHTRSALAVRFTSKIEYILVPASQIDRYVDSVSAMASSQSWRHSAT